VRCDVFVTESTFGLPIYRWQPPHETFADIAAWWRGNAAAGRTSLLYGYAFGKAQRILAGVRDAGALDVGPIVCHGAVEVLNDAYRATGVALPPAHRVDDVAKADLPRALVLAPPSAAERRGCAASATPATRSRRDGCGCAARAAGARSTAASRSPITPTGRASWPRSPRPARSA
jgi:hypothetical protein